MPPSLEVINLGSDFRNTNKFTGGIPAEWGSLTNLKELNMSWCGLDGRLPASIGNLMSLQTLVLSSNRLEGQCTRIVC